MRKYFVLIRLGVLDSIAWRGNMIYWIIIDILGVAIVPFLWIAVIGAGGKPIAGFSVADIITYFIGIGLIWQGVVTYPFWYLILDIRDGLLANDLVRPYSYIGKLFFYNIGSRMMRLMISLPFLIIILIVLRKFIVLPSSWLHIGMLIPALIVAFTLIFLMHFVVGTVAFWFEEGFAVSSMFMYV
ncbi:ABC-2 family transporter protein, partial [Candidatus Uhrbacteria bacterium]|nr:ABC-2 family transporter protein [Candidatus Uhrbacteria bacterium]